MSNLCCTLLGTDMSGERFTTRVSVRMLFEEYRK